MCALATLLTNSTLTYYTMFVWATFLNGLTLVAYDYVYLGYLAPGLISTLILHCVLVTICMLYCADQFYSQGIK